MIAKEGLPALRRWPVGRKIAVRGPSAGFVVDNREPSPSATAGLAEGWGASLSRLSHFGGSQAEGAAGCREPVPARCGPAVLDLRQSTVR